MATEASITQRLRSYFIGKGMQESEASENSRPENGCLIFSGTNTISAVKVLREDQLSSRNSVLEAVLSTASLMSRFNQVYLALPKFVSSTIESSVIEEHGIGLVIYDESMVVEVVAPRYLQIINQPTQMPRVVEESSQILLQELGALKSRLSFLEETIESLKSEVTHLKSWRPTITHVNSAPSAPMTQALENTPSFIRDNPWIDVLSRRGRESERFAS